MAATGLFCKTQCRECGGRGEGDDGKVNTVFLENAILYEQSINDYFLFRIHAEINFGKLSSTH